MKVRIKNPIWGVPITFLDKYCPTQFEIIGGFNGYKECDYENALLCGTPTEYVDKNGKTKIWTGPTINKKTVYYRILIRHKAKNVGTSTDNGTEVANIITDNTPNEVIEEKKPFFKRFKVVLNKIGCALLSLITFFTIS